MITSFLGPVVSEAAGAGVMFLMFFVISLTGVFYLYFFMKETTYVYESKGGSNEIQKRWMTLEEKKYVYTPKDLSKIESTNDDQSSSKQ